MLRWPSKTRSVFVKVIATWPKGEQCLLQGLWLCDIWGGGNNKEGSEVLKIGKALQQWTSLLLIAWKTHFHKTIRFIKKKKKKSHNFQSAGRSLGNTISVHLILVATCTSYWFSRLCPQQTQHIPGHREQDCYMALLFSCCQANVTAAACSVCWNNNVMKTETRRQMNFYTCINDVCFSFRN